MRRAAIIIILSALFSSGCRVKKEIPTEQHSAPLSESFLKKSLTQAQQFDFFSATAKVKLQTPEQSIKGKIWIRSQPDSVIWAVVKKASIEGGRAQMTRDSTSIIYRLEKKYQKVGNHELSEYIGLYPDLPMLSQMLIGHSIPIDTLSLWQASEDSINWNINASHEDYLMKLKVDKYNGHLISGEINTNIDGSGSFEYSDFREVINGVTLPYKRSYKFQSNDQGELLINLDFSEIELNIPKEIKFEIPSHYERIR